MFRLFQCRLYILLILGGCGSAPPKKPDSQTSSIQEPESESTELETEKSENAIADTVKEEEKKPLVEEPSEPEPPASQDAPILEMPDLTTANPEIPTEPVTEIINEVMTCESLEYQVQECNVAKGKIINVELKEQLSSPSIYN